MASNNKSGKIHGGDLVAQALAAHNVEYIFTLCGGHISPILIGCEKMGMRIIDVRDEKNAAFAADATSRLTGVPGVVSITAGPGLTNTITAIKNAQLAESPLIVLGGATATMLEGRGSLQDIDQLGLLETATKWRKSVRRAKDIPKTISEAFYQALSGVPGPVFVELPVDVLYPEEIVKEWYGKKNTGKESLIGKIVNWYINRHVNKLFEGMYDLPKPTPKIPAIPLASVDQIERVNEKLQHAIKPIMVLSSQVMLNVEKVPHLQEVIEKMNIPVFLSGTARGLLGKNHRLHIRHKRSKALREADVIILVGVPLDFRLDYGRVLNRNGTVIGINLDKSTLNMNKLFRGIDIKIRAEPFDTLDKISMKLSVDSSQWKDWHNELLNRQQARDEEIRKTAEEETEFVNPLQICFEIDQVMEDNSVIIADGGDFVATMSYILQPRDALRWLDPGPYGTLGVGAGFAIGAKLKYVNSTVWLIYGDGAAGFSINEFDTFVRHNIPVIAIIGNDASWQQIAREQVELFETSLGTDLAYTNYDQVAEGYGAVGLSIEQPEQVKEVLQTAIKHCNNGKPVLVNVKIGKTDFRKGSISM